MNNYELGGPHATTPFPVSLIEGFVYDPGSAGGCTIVETDRDGNRIREYVGIAGTSTNCAGGITPSATWLAS
ncbi:MAG TPA: alkaline phosphatase PhoX [Pseudonocardiaceae bacterium]|nr:alkaline phosphatase PhoX [Pseudonocardiaceae bacterium]